MKWFRTSCTLSLINESDKWLSDAEQALDDNIPISLTNESDEWSKVSLTNESDEVI